MSASSEIAELNGGARVAVFASGSGSNALSLMRRFNLDNKQAIVAVLVSNKPECGAVRHAKECGVEVILINHENFVSGTEIIERLNTLKIDWIVLAGFLWKVPIQFVKAFDRRIINLHPSLLPKYGGKGMYGKHVHEAVVAARESETGITLHLVNENYDEGEIIFQAAVAVDVSDDAMAVEAKVREFERRYFTEQVAAFINRNGRVE